MKVKHVLMIAAVLLAMFVTPVMADDSQSGDVTIGAEYAAVYTIDIPETVNFVSVSEGATVSAAIGVTITTIDPNSLVDVSVSNEDGWYLKHESGTGYRIAYNMTVDGVEVAHNGVVLSTATTAGKDVLFTLKEGAEKSGKYTDTLTFTATMQESDDIETRAAYSAEELTNVLSELTEGVPTTISLGSGRYTFPSTDLTDDVTLICEEGTVFEGTSSLSSNGATVVGATFSNPTGNAVNGNVNGVFKDCTFTGSNGLQGCYAGETVVFEDCVFEGSRYCVHFDGGANDVKFIGCTFSGFNAFGDGITQLTFEDCTFDSDRTNLYGNTTMIRCEFAFDGTNYDEGIDCLTLDKTYVFEDCTVCDNAYTPLSYWDYPIFSTSVSSGVSFEVMINGVSTDINNPPASSE